MSRVLQLSDVCEITMGQAPNGESYNDKGEGLPLIAGAGDFDDRYPKAKKHTTEASKICGIGDIVLGIRATIGEKVISDGRYCLGRGVAGLRAGPSLDANYLWHWLTHSNHLLVSKARGATFLQVNRGDIGELPIRLPPLSEQRRIAAILDQADALRAKRREALAQLDRLAQSVFIEMFGDPVANPKAWTTVKFGEVGTLDRGVSKHRPRNAPELLGGNHPLVQTGEVANCDGYIRSYTSTYSDLGLRQSKMWSAGTLCITIAANIAKTGILTFDACFPDSVVGFRSDNPATVEYVRVWLSFLQKSLEDSAPESAQKNINLAILRGLNIPLPPLHFQQTFATRIQSIESLKAQHRAALAKLDALFASLQQRAFRGGL